MEKISFVELLIAMATVGGLAWLTCKAVAWLGYIQDKTEERQRRKK